MTDVDLTPEPSEDQERSDAAVAIVRVFHELHPRIPGLEVGDCHCNLLAEVALDALNLPERRDVAYRAGREDAAEAVWAKSQELRGKPFRSGEVGIEYVNGMEDATEIARGSGDR